MRQMKIDHRETSKTIKQTRKSIEFLAFKGFSRARSILRRTLVVIKIMLSAAFNQETNNVRNGSKC